MQSQSMILNGPKRLIESQGTPLYLRGIVKPILHWLESLPHHILDAHPSLWVAYASTLLLTWSTYIC